MGGWAATPRRTCPALPSNQPTNQPSNPAKKPTNTPSHAPAHPAVDLDQAYGMMSTTNYADLASQRPPAAERTASANATEAALLGERDAVMLSSLHAAALEW